MRWILLLTCVFVFAPLAVHAGAVARETEPNNSAATANPVSLGARIEAVNPSSGDKDFFRFTLAEAGEVRIVSVKPPNASAGLAFTLQTAGGEVLQIVTVNADNEQAFLIRTLAPGDYIILAHNRMMFSGPYWFRVDFTPASAAPPTPAAPAAIPTPAPAASPATPAAPVPAPSVPLATTMVSVTPAAPASGPPTPGGALAAEMKDGIAWEVEPANSNAASPTVLAGADYVIGTMTKDDRDYFLIWNEGVPDTLTVQVFGARLGIPGVSFNVKIHDLATGNGGGYDGNYAVPLRGNNEQRARTPCADAAGSSDPVFYSAVGAKWMPLEKRGWYLVEVSGSGGPIDGSEAPYALQVRSGAAPPEAAPPANVRSAARAGSSVAPDSVPAAGGGFDLAHPPVPLYAGMTKSLIANDIVERNGTLAFSLQLTVRDLPPELEAGGEIRDDSGAQLACVLLNAGNREGNTVSLRAGSLRVSDLLPRDEQGHRLLPPGRYTLRLLAGDVVFHESPFRLVENVRGDRFVLPEFENWFQLQRQRDGWTPAPSTLRLHGVNITFAQGELPAAQPFIITVFRGREVVARGTNEGWAGPGAFARGTSTWKLGNGQDPVLAAGSGRGEIFQYFSHDGTYHLEASWGRYGKWRSVDFAVRGGNPVAQGRQAADYAPATRRIVEDAGTFWLEGSRVE